MAPTVPRPGAPHALAALVASGKALVQAGVDNAVAARRTLAAVCVAVLPAPLRAVVVAVVAAAAVSGSVLLSFGVPLVVGHRLFTLGPEYLSHLSDAYMIAVGMWVTTLCTLRSSV